MSRAPYKYLDYYTFEDADLFFGREEETQRMVGEILSTRLLVLFSPSGSGKTSLINAGVRPQLENMGYQTIYTRLETEPISSVCNAVTRELKIDCDENVSNLYEFLKTVTSRTEKPLVIFLDQFEEFFTVFREQYEKRRKFIDQLAKIKYDDQLPVFFVLSLREDYFVNLHEFRDAIHSIFQNNANLRLENFSDEEARRAIVYPLKAKDIDASIEDKLVNKLILDLRDSQPGIEPIKLQIVCHTLWERKPQETNRITLADYQTCDGADAILSRHVQNLLNKIPKRQHGFMVRIFEALKTEYDTKRFRSFGELQKELKIKKPERLAKMLDKFVDLHILRSEEKEKTIWYEFKHDYLVGEIARWMQCRKENLMQKHVRYALIPGITLIILLIIWAVIQFNSFEARFTDQEYWGQHQEIEIVRKFNPFQYKITTGILYSDLKDLKSRNLIKNRFTVGTWRKNDWSSLVEKLSIVRAGKLLYCTGHSQDAIEKLLFALRDGNWYIRYQAAIELGTISKYDETITEELINTLKDNDQRVREQAAWALGKLSKTDTRVITAMVGCLEAKEKEIVVDLSSLNLRLQVAWALGVLGKTDDTVIAALVNALKDRSLYISTQAGLPLETLGKSEAGLTKAEKLDNALEDQNWNVRFQAAWALGVLGKADERVIEALINALQDQSWNVRSQAAWALGTLGKADEKIIEALINSLKDQYLDVRSQAVWALGMLGEGNDRVIQALLIALKDVYWWTGRHHAAWALGTLGKADSTIINVLVNTLKDHNVNVRYWTAWALGMLGKTNYSAIEALLNTFKDENSEVRTQAVWSLVSLAKTDEIVMRALFKALKNDNPNVRLLTAYVLGILKRIDDITISEMVNMLQDLDWNVRYMTAWALGNIGKADAKIIEALHDALKDQYWTGRFQAAWALGMLDKTNETIIEAIVNALKYQDVNDRSQAALALGTLGKTDEIIIESLVNALKDQDSNVRSQAAGSLIMLGKTDEIINAILLKALKDENPNARLQAAWILGALGKSNPCVIDTLMAALKDQDEYVRSQSAAALGMLLKSKETIELIDKFLKNDLSGYRTAGVQALARKDSITDYIIEEINQLKDNSKCPWVRLGAWEAYVLIQQRLADEKAANQFIHKADSLFQINNFWQAEKQYQSAFDQLTKIIRIDSLKIARTKFQQAHCTARMKRLVPTLDHLEIAFQYNQVWRDTLTAELDQKEGDWAFMKENWYLKEVLLKNSKSQMTNSK